MRSFIIIKGQPKGLQIEQMRLGGNGVYDVKFRNSQTTYHYRRSDVCVIADAQWHDHLHCKVVIDGREQRNVADIRSFRQGERTHWRITYGNGFVQDCLHGSVQVVESCLKDDVARNTFGYLKRIAQVNELGKDEEHGGILPALYERIDFIEPSSAAAAYLHPTTNAVKKHSAPPLVFPFGCNASQERAVTAAFENQISVIQGPPGTGKTQTILNIIANILIQGKTVMVVSNNNSATVNVLEKLGKYGLYFIVAPLGRRENKEAFIRQQPTVPDDLPTWSVPAADMAKGRQTVAHTLVELRKAFTLQEALSSAKQELKALELEWEHFKRGNDIQDNACKVKRNVKSQRVMSLWLRYQSYAEGETVAPGGIFGRLVERLKWVWRNFIRRFRLGIKQPFDRHDPQPVVLELQATYYLTRIKELTDFITDTAGQLSAMDAKALNESLTARSMYILKGVLHGKYHAEPRRVFTDVGDMHTHITEFVREYPVVLSTTFSARTALPRHTFDYLIVDEASQVSVDTGALALTCARNAVIVGDSLQLPNVVTEDDRLKLDAIFNEYQVAQGYHCAEYSFLQSVCTVIPDIVQTLLREHYRCHPKIINFCNQRFYGGSLLIMTEDHGEKDMITAVKTVPGHHTRGHYNQREIDVVRQEVLPTMEDIATEDIGIITPYNQQVDAFRRQLPSIEAATIHKYQGREKDTIIMSVVDDRITEFADDPNLLNVAISRAKERFCLVVSGNEQERKGHISDLLDYIAYNNFSVTDSKVCSIFDYLYSHYTTERMAFLARHRHISEYDSENLTYAMITDILREHPEYAHLGVFCHTPLRTLFHDWSPLNDEERRYIAHYATHLDFLIVNRVAKKPVLAIETDGYNFHNESTGQHRRDMMKDHVLALYGIPLLRLSTTGSGEGEQIASALAELV